MLVILSEKDSIYYNIMAGDTFNISVTGIEGTDTILTEVFDTPTIIDYFATFIFCDESGKSYGKNISAFTGQQDNLPCEISTAKRLKDLSISQLRNLRASSGIDIRY